MSKHLSKVLKILEKPSHFMLYMLFAPPSKEMACVFFLPEVHPFIHEPKISSCLINCYLQQLLIKEFYWKIFSKRLHTMRVRTTLKVHCYQHIYFLVKITPAIIEINSSWVGLKILAKVIFALWTSYVRNYSLCKKGKHEVAHFLRYLTDFQEFFFLVPGKFELRNLRSLGCA